jgi:hypothetical protein
MRFDCKLQNRNCKLRIGFSNSVRLEYCAGDGGAVLPGFELDLAELFAELPPE